MCCQQIMDESEKISWLCCNMQHRIGRGNKGYDELESLGNIVNNERIEFSAAGFFPVNRSTICSLLSSVTTYFIVVKQFD